MTRFLPIRWVAGAVTTAAIVLLGSCGGGGGGTSGMPAPTATIGVSPTSIAAGQSAMLTWSSTDASTCSASGAWTGSQSTNGSVGVSQSAPGTYTYTLGCSSSTSNAVPESATLTVTPAPLSIITGGLPNGVIGAPYNQPIQANGGVSPFAWTVSNGSLPDNLSLSPSTTNTVTIIGAPGTIAQGVTFTIQVTDFAHHTATQAYTVSILLPDGSVALSPGNLDFGNVVVGSTNGALTETLTNNATLDLAITSIATTGSNASEFKQTSTTCGTSLAAGTSCAINLTFTPGQMGPRTAALTINDDSTGSPQSVGLSGVGVTAGPNATLSAVSVPFGTQLVGTTSPVRSVALANYGTVTLNVGSIAASTSYAETDNCVPSLASGATCTIGVTFTPGGSGAVTGTLSISDDAAGSPQNVALSGNGSTMTPLLTGYCVTQCGIAKDFAACPVGKPSETPAFVDLGRRCGFGPEVSATVDLARSCVVINHHIIHGECEAQ